MEALLCANIVWHILTNHTSEVLVRKNAYVHLYMYTSTEYSQIYWPQYQQIIKLNEKITYQQENITHREFTKTSLHNP